MIIFSILGIIFIFIIRYIKKLYSAPDSDEVKFFKTFENWQNNELLSPLLEDFLGFNDNENHIIEKISQKQIGEIKKKENI